MSGVAGSGLQWPALPWSEWEATANTLHMWTQIVGKTRLALTPLQNHWWNVPLYVTAHGLGTSAMVCGDDVLDIEFDFLAHVLHLRLGSGKEHILPLRAQTVADFYKEYLECLAAIGVSVEIWPMPVEVANPIRFDLDTEHKSYDPEYAHRFWQVLVQAEKVFRAWGTGFLGKVSPVHFFWGSFDMAVTRFSGRRAPLHPGGVPGLPDAITREAYSHEVSSAGFWPGSATFPMAAFYSYAYPEPEGFRNAPLAAGAHYDATLGEFILPYDKVRTSADPQGALLEFLAMTYEAAAATGKWDSAALECDLGTPARVRSVS